MTIQFSFNNSKTWSKKILIHEGPSAYSNLVQINNSEIACLFEGGENSPYEGIAFKKISIKNLKQMRVINIIFIVIAVNLINFSKF